VFNTPHDYSYSTRPVPEAAKTGMWDNRRNYAAAGSRSLWATTARESMTVFKMHATYV
jgi:hypothetical protein